VRLADADLDLPASALEPHGDAGPSETVVVRSAAAALLAAERGLDQVCDLPAVGVQGRIEHVSLD
jgi:hypothetical protein